MELRLRNSKKRNPAVQKLLDAGQGQAADAGRWLADLVRAAVPNSIEDVYHRVPTWATQQGKVFAHVAVFSKHATLGFFQGATLEDSDGILEGTGKGHRQVQVAAPDAVPKAKLIKLIKQAAQ